MNSKLSSQKIWASSQGSIYAKLFIVIILLLLLQIPISCIQGVISERIQTRSDAEAFISQRSGRDQTITPPILSIPYILRSRNAEKVEHREKVYAELLPEDLKI